MYRYDEFDNLEFTAPLSAAELEICINNMHTSQLVLIKSSAEKSGKKLRDIFGTERKVTQVD